MNDIEIERAIKQLETYPSMVAMYNSNLANCIVMDINNLKSALACKQVSEEEIEKLVKPTWKKDAVEWAMNNFRKATYPRASSFIQDDIMEYIEKNVVKPLIKQLKSALNRYNDAKYIKGAKAIRHKLPLQNK